MLRTLSSCVLLLASLPAMAQAPARALGRFWHVRPQRTAYVPGPLLKAGTNKIVVFDMLPTGTIRVRTLDHPVLDVPAINAIRSQQE